MVSSIWLPCDPGTSPRKAELEFRVKKTDFMLRARYSVVKDREERWRPLLGQDGEIGVFLG